MAFGVLNIAEAKRTGSWRCPYGVRDVAQRIATYLNRTKKVREVFGSVGKQNWPTIRAS
jgi:hypothetical protein